MPTMKSAILLTLALLTTFAAGQVGTLLDPSKLPKCAFSCQTLLSAQQLCVPPTAPQQDQAIYQTCFCNSNYLVNYKAGAVSPTCDDACSSETDRQAIQQWFVSLCSSGAVVTPVGNAVNVAATATGTAATTTSTGANEGSGGGGPKSWISTHYQWIIMIIVLILAAIAAIFFGRWFRRRQERKFATGGYARDSILQTQDITNSLSNRHPVPEMTSVSRTGVTPANDGSTERLAGGSAAADMFDGNVDPEAGRGSKLQRLGSVLRKGPLRR